MWGLLFGASSEKRRPRVIPTRVGTTGWGAVGSGRGSGHPHACGDYSRRRLSSSRSSGHPHACGDYGCTLEGALAERGSSPRVWGLRGVHSPGGGRGRVIPTRVGTTSRRIRCPLIQSGHPHACGDYSLEAPAKPSFSGSSPRVWGLRPAPLPRVRERRVIPTRVGTTATWNLQPHMTTGHPHACGDYLGTARKALNRARVIPTRVGTTADGGKVMFERAGHPHACGDYGPGRIRGQRNRGSSPRVWGLLLPSSPNIGYLRVIPTRVGTTPPQIAWPIVRPGHPHACGDYPEGMGKDWTDYGSSPRVWGLRYRPLYGASAPRVIPTRVGTTLRFTKFP